MGKHFNRSVWESYDTWRTREPGDEPQKQAEFDEDAARAALEDAEDSPRRYGRVRVHLYDEM